MRPRRLMAIIPITLVAHLLHGPLGVALASRRSADMDGLPAAIVLAATTAGYLLSGLIIALVAIAIPALVLRGARRAPSAPDLRADA